MTTSVSDKIYTIANNIVPITKKSPLNQKHACVVLDHGKPIVTGYNQDRMTNSGSIMISFHAEMTAILLFLRQMGLFDMTKLINDTPYGMAFRDQNILKGSAVIQW
jgi:hypothetical protein